MKIVNTIQGSPEWIRWRRQHLGASDTGTVLGLNPYNNQISLWEEKVLGIERPSNRNMKRGQELEPIARMHYIMSSGLLVNAIVAEDSLFSYLSASFDGLTKELSHAVEIKCGKKSFEMAKVGDIPPYYFAQLQHQMMIADLQSIDYYCFDGHDGILIPVERNESFISDMLDKLHEFWHCVVNFKQPRSYYETVRAFP